MGYEDWRVSGSYFEVCNCEAICPCRRVRGNRGGRASYDSCDFAISWRILDGHADRIGLDGLSVVLAGRYVEDEPGTPWRVILYVDDRATAPQYDALSAIFLGRAGGSTLRNFARAIAEVHAVRRAAIRLDHTSNQERMDIDGILTVATARPAAEFQAVSCGISGHDRPGQEIVASIFQLDDDPLAWSFQGRCGFAANFDYDSRAA